MDYQEDLVQDSPWGCLGVRRVVARNIALDTFLQAADLVLVFGLAAGGHDARDIALTVEAFARAVEVWALALELAGALEGDWADLLRSRADRGSTRATVMMRRLAQAGRAAAVGVEAEAAL